MGTRCSNCNNVMFTGYYYKFLKLACLLELLHSEQNITTETFEDMMDCLTSFKRMALDKDEKMEELEVEMNNTK